MCILSQIKTYYRKHNADRIVQGDILRDIKFIDWDWDVKKGDVITIEKELPYTVILTQDCDLEQDFRCRNNSKTNNDKMLQSVLVCPAWGWEEFIKGDHLLDFDSKMEIIPTARQKQIKIQQVARYHYLDSDLENQIPPLVIDFKHYYTLPINFLGHIYKKHYVTSVNELFRESLCQRFSFYLSRIGLPEIKTNE